MLSDSIMYSLVEFISYFYYITYYNYFVSSVDQSEGELKPNKYISCNNKSGLFNSRVWICVFQVLTVWNVILLKFKNFTL